MKIKTAELNGPAIDWAVAFIEKLPNDLLTWDNDKPVVVRTVLDHTDKLRCEFSTNWSQGGPIIERERIRLDCAWGDQWGASHPDSRFAAKRAGYTGWYAGPTPLVAAMRCYVASKLGDEVDVPDELVY